MNPRINLLTINYIHN